MTKHEKFHRMQLYFSNLFMHIKELGHIVLYVSNIEIVGNFYRDILGFHEIHRGEGIALFSGGRTHHEMLLIETQGTPKPQESRPLGLYHIGFKIGDSPEDAKKVYQELKDKNVTIVGTGDHTVTHSIYILDPDGNELELYADVSNEWKTNPAAILSPTKWLDLE